MELKSPREAKRSLSIRGHRTSVSLEPAFWDELKRLATSERVSVAELVARIDEARAPGGGSLSSALRIWVLARIKAGA